jgi:PAS domain S-box-containing protein
MNTLLATSSAFASGSPAPDGSRLTGLQAQLIAESIPHIVWMASADGATTFFNRRGTEYTGCSADTNYDWNWVTLVHPDDAERARDAWERATRTETDYALDYRIRRFDGTFRWHTFRALPLRNPDGEVHTWIGTATDIDDHQRMETSLRRSEQEAVESLTLLQSIEAAATVGFKLVDRDLRVVRINEKLARISGIPVAEQIGRSVAEISPDLWPQLEDVYRRALSGEAVSNIELSTPSAEEPERVRHWLASYYPVRTDGQIIGVGNVVFDITERREAEEFRKVVMANMAEGLYALDADGLVTYMNRAASKMLGWAEDELRGKPMHEAVHFQRADGSAFAVEDCPLRKVRTEGRSARIDDDAFTRRDGSIFPVAYSSAPLGGGTGNQGVVVVFRDITDEKNDQASVQRELAALSWVGRIRDAIDENRLVLYSQPIVSLTGGRPTEELLLRMIGRDGEIIQPGSFLPVAEKFGLIIEIDRWVVTEAIRIAASSQRAIEVNLSAKSIGTSDLLPLIEHQIREHGADPANLVFEITETALMRDLTAGQAFAHGLAEIGCGVALDDFGTGYGSFTYLKTLPITYLKIDIEFVRDLVTNQANRHVVKAIVSLAKAFGLRTIAEGIEDEETLTLLRAEGVDFGQGFHLGRPAPVTPHVTEDASAAGAGADRYFLASG